MTEYTCKDCKWWKDEGRTMGCCEARNNKVFDDGDPMCADFETKSGKRPRFCRLASSVDEMAEELVICMSVMWMVTPTGDVFRKTELKEALAAAKAWLLEVEE